jgi:hypothetical protein
VHRALSRTAPEAAVSNLMIDVDGVRVADTTTNDYQ